MIEKVLVVGGTGRLGRLVVEQLLTAGISVRILARHKEVAEHLFPPEVECVEGDVRDKASLMPAIAGTSHLICAIGATYFLGKNSPKRVDYEGVKNLIEIAQEQSIQHFLYISSILVTQPTQGIFTFLSGNVLKWKGLAEQALRQSDLPYTIIRPGGLKDDLAEKGIQIGQGDTLRGQICRQSLATVCLQAIQQPPRQLTFEVINTAGEEPDHWSSLFDPLQSAPS